VNGVGSSRGVDVPAALAQAVEVLDEVVHHDWDSVAPGAGARVLQVLEQVQRRVGYVQAKVLNGVEASGEWSWDGARSVGVWIAQQVGVTRGEASQVVRLSRALRDHLPNAATALAHGRIGVGHARVLAGSVAKTPALERALGCDEVGESFLVDAAAQLGVGEFKKVVHHWVMMADPEGAERGWRKQENVGEVFLSPTMGGYVLNGFLNVVDGQIVNKALQASMGRKGRDDDRPAPQRRAAALVEMSQGWLDSGELLPGARIRPHITVTVPFVTLEKLCEATDSALPEGRGGQHVISAGIDFSQMLGAEPATLEDGSAIPHTVLARLACDSEIMRVVFGPHSTILDAGRTQRIFPPHQTRAIIARDRHCQYPGCDEPPSHGEIHHSLWWWKHHGKTNVTQGILLCWHHHAYVHQRNITITRTRAGWVFTTDHGSVIQPPSHASGMAKSTPARSQSRAPYNPLRPVPPRGAMWPRSKAPPFNGIPDQSPQVLPEQRRYGSPPASPG